MDRYPVFGVFIDRLSLDELFARLSVLRGLVITPNPEILLAARNNRQYQTLLASSALSIPDGIAIRFAVAALHGVLGLPRHTGVDVVPMLPSIAERNQETLVLFGGFSDDVERIRHQFLETYPTLCCVTIDPGVISEESPKLPHEILERILFLGPSIVVVGLGQGKGKSQGKQEKICQDILSTCAHVRLAIGVGGAFDMLAGRSLRSPVVLQKFGFEWLWRLMKEPWRFRRIFRAVIVFPILVAWDTLRHGRFIAACRSVVADLRLHFFQ